jgi:TolB-like protein/class 3 adenylate cyclase/Flp pilus assembly protein TadD
MPEIARRLTAILAADVVGYSRLAGADEESTLSRLRALRDELLDPAIQNHRGRVVKRTGDGALVEFASVVDGARCALAIQRGMAAYNAGLGPTRRIDFRIGIHVGDVVVESDGDLMGDGVNIAARLEGICATGGICLSEDAYRQVRDKLKEEYIDLGEKSLKNIARPVRVFAIDLQHPYAEATSPPHLSIVVLPFANIGGDPEEEYFADGVTESLTTDLSRIRNSVVIGRHTAFTYKGKGVDLKQVGRELNVRYVLEGSVQRAANRVRVNVQLIDAETGSHLWAERFDRENGDLFEMQDEIVARLAHSLNAQFIAAEARRAERAINPDSIDLYFRAMAVFSRGLNPTSFAQTRDLLQQAIALDPSNVDALTWLAVLLGQTSANAIMGERAALLAGAENAATRAHGIAPENAMVHTALALVYAYSNRTEAAIAEAERAIELDPNHNTGYAALVAAKLYGGRAAEVEAHVMQALRLSPRDTYLYLFYAAVGTAKFYLGKDEEAVIWLRRSIEANRLYPAAHYMMAAVLANLGRLADAKQAAAQTLKMDPTFTIRRFIAAAATDNPIYLAQRERTIDGLRKAGVPDG